MRARRLFWHLFPTYVLVAVLSLVAVDWLATRSIREFNRQRSAEDLAARGALLDLQMGDGDPAARGAEVDRLCKEAGRRTGARFTVILDSGVVVGDSEEDPARMDNHGSRPEVREAQRGGVGTSTRFSDTLRRNMLYVAVPMRRDGRMAGVVRASFPLVAVQEHLVAVRRRVLAGSALIALAAAALSLVVSRRVSRPLERIRRAAERYASGDLEGRVRAPEILETARLAESLNAMAAQLDERIQTVVRDRNEKDALFASMVEGVLAVDASERLVDLNAAAAALLRVDAAAARGRPLLEVVRNPDLEQVVAGALAGGPPVEADVTLRDVEERSIQAHGTALCDREGRRLGALVTLYDVTRLKRLEAVRRDFVANVSHELKTPITSIRAAAETLLDTPELSSPDGRRFLEMIDRHAARLNALIEDMLTLARIEHDAERRLLPLARGRVDSVVADAAASCAAAAAEKRIRVDVECAPGLEAMLNVPLLEQAVANLLRNAIQYSEDGSAVRATARRDGGEIVIAVADQGCGIEARHLPRLFERFYCVDSARSRALGGTGLGLAIVRHIVLAHGGRVEAHSAVGEGSTFTIRLPVP